MPHSFLGTYVVFYSDTCFAYHDSGWELDRVSTDVNVLWVHHEREREEIIQGRHRRGTDLCLFDS